MGGGGAGVDGFAGAGVQRTQRARAPAGFGADAGSSAGFGAAGAGAVTRATVSATRRRKAARSQTASLEWGRSTRRPSSEGPRNLPGNPPPRVEAAVYQPRARAPRACRGLSAGDRAPREADAVVLEPLIERASR